MTLNTPNGIDSWFDDQALPLDSTRSKMSTSKWDTDLLTKEVSVVESHAFARQLNHLVWLINNHQQNGEQWVADIYADEYFKLFGVAINCR